MKAEENTYQITDSELEEFITNLKWQTSRMSCRSLIKLPPVQLVTGSEERHWTRICVKRAHRLGQEFTSPRSGDCPSHVIVVPCTRLDGVTAGGLDLHFFSSAMLRAAARSTRALKVRPASLRTTRFANYIANYVSIL